MLKRGISGYFKLNNAYYMQKSLISRKYFSIYNFSDRHVGTNQKNLDELSKFIGYPDTNSLIKDTIPSNIRLTPIDGNSTCLNKVPEFGLSEESALSKLEEIFNKNNVDKNRSFLGMGYYDTITPPVLVRNFLENPAWYTPYTPYQAEIAQGRLESLFNYQTMISSLTGLPYANSSLLDEASAAVEAFMISYSIRKNNAPTTYLIDINAHPQIKELIKTRASCFPDIKLEINHIEKHDYRNNPVFGILIQYPDTNGVIYNAKLLEIFINGLKSNPNPPIITMATDLLALTLIKPPGEIGADIALGNSQRFGVPLGCGGPHAAFFATTKELLRKMPGRIIGMTRHAGQSADEGTRPTSFRMTLQTREQHIRRAKAGSNICTAQALLANLAVNYAIYHGPAGLRSIAINIHQKMQKFIDLFKYNNNGFIVNNSGSFFDTINIKIPNHFANNLNVATQVKQLTGFNIRVIDSRNIGISFDETTEHEDILKLYHAITGNSINKIQLTHHTLHAQPLVPEHNIRTSPFLTHPVFNKYHTETEMMRYLHRLQSKDLGLQNSMIPLGSCTMKLNAAAEMIPLTWKNVSRVHPYAPNSDKVGYIELTDKLREWLADITGFADVSLQPNSGATGEYTGLLVISAYLASIGQQHRNICLIPDSAHGTNPASATIAGYNIVTISTDKEGNVDYSDLKNKVKKYENELAAIMITYPSTFGVFEEKVVEICDLVHQAGGQVYMDGANMNAQVGITSPGEIGADVCHLNLHKTFCIPHGGGGPGMGPIGVAKHLVDFLPGNPNIQRENLNNTNIGNAGGNIIVGKPIGPVAAAMWGSASILPISYQYIAMMGAQGLLHATRTAIVNANYMMVRLKDHYPIVYTNEKGRIAHEFIIDIRKIHKKVGITAIDVSKRLQDYGFHGPTNSWPIPNTMMIEPTESESKEEMDRYCDALIEIRKEIQEIIDNHEKDPENKEILENNLLKNAPHSLHMLSDDKWNFPYTRERAGYPLPWLRQHKHWPTIGRVDESYGDKILVTNWYQFSENVKINKN